mgnify:CR=1 FL=1
MIRKRHVSHIGELSRDNETIDNSAGKSNICIFKQKKNDQICSALVVAAVVVVVEVVCTEGVGANH